MAGATYRRTLLKVSGEALMGDAAYGIDSATVARVARQIQAGQQAPTEMAVVVGGGNIFRGSEASAAGMDRATADYAGMLATVINALALQDALEKLGVTVRTQSAINVQQVAEQYIRRRAIRHLEKGRVVIFAAGTGNPYMTTDTAAAPRKEPGARRFPTLSYMEAISRRLGVMDSTALSLCMENDLPIVVFDLAAEDSVAKAMRGEGIGTLVGKEESVLVGA